MPLRRRGGGRALALHGPVAQRMVSCVPLPPAFALQVSGPAPAWAVDNPHPPRRFCHPGRSPSAAGPTRRKSVPARLAPRQMQPPATSKRTGASGRGVSAIWLNAHKRPSIDSLHTGGGHFGHPSLPGAEVMMGIPRRHPSRPWDASPLSVREFILKVPFGGRP